MSFLFLPPGGAPFFMPPVDTAADLPGIEATGAIILALDTGTLYYFDGASWIAIPSYIGPTSISDTNSIDLTSTVGVLSADLKLSSNAADAGSTIVALDIESTSVHGLRAQILNSGIRGLFGNTAPVAYNSATGVYSMAAAATAVNGYLTSTDWNTFNSKVPTTITIGTTAPLTGGGDLSTNRTIAIPVATTLADGYLSSTDWTTFNNKVATTRTINTTSPLTGGGNLSSDRTFAIPAATGSVNGYLTSTDWTTFNSKQAAIPAATTASQSSGTTSNVGSTGTWGYAISESLAAGRWLIWGVAGFAENGAVLTTSLSAGISSSSTGSGIDEFQTAQMPYLISGSADAILTTPFLDVTLVSPTTYYLNTRFYYTSGTPKHRGRITALQIG